MVKNEHSKCYGLFSHDFLNAIDKLLTEITYYIIVLAQTHAHTDTVKFFSTNLFFDSFKDYFQLIHTNFFCVTITITIKLFSKLLFGLGTAMNYICRSPTNKVRYSNYTRKTTIKKPKNYYRPKSNQ